MAACLTGRDDVLVDAIAYHHYLVGLKSQRLHTQRKDTRIGLTYAHHSTLDDLLEEVLETKLAQHGMDIAIEIANEHHGEMTLERHKHLATMERLLVGVLIEFVEQGIEVRHEGLDAGIESHQGRDAQLQRTIGGDMLMEIVQLQTELGLERLAEGELGLDDGVAPQGTLAMHVSLAIMFLTHGHLLMLVGMPDDLAPVLSARIERATVVENITFNHYPNWQG